MLNPPRPVLSRLVPILTIMTLTMLQPVMAEDTCYDKASVVINNVSGSVIEITRLEVESGSSLQGPSFPLKQAPGSQTWTLVQNGNKQNGKIYMRKFPYDKEGYAEYVMGKHPLCGLSASNRNSTGLNIKNDIDDKNHVITFKIMNISNP